MFSCTFCSKTFPKRAHLSTHTHGHTKEKPHKCRICSATFGHASSLKRHVKCVHNGHKIIKNRNSHCPLCSYKCYTNLMLKIHMRKHSDQLPFSCNVSGCAFKTKYEESLKNHVRIIHNDERRYECPSDGCSYKSKRRGDLQKHLKVHSSEKPFACKVPGCDYACKMKSYLTAHTSRAHSDEKPFKCSLCDFRAKLRPDIIQHEQRHLGKKRYECRAPNCSFASLTKVAVEIHFDRKHRKKDILCTEPRCSFRCGSITLLKYHLKRHGNSRLKCPVDSCSYSSTCKQYLVKHISSRHKDLRSVTVVGRRILDTEATGTAGTTDTTLHCHFSDCGFQTKIQRHYDRHIDTHDKEEKRHVCTFCFSRFSNFCLLKTHLNVHTGENSYSCSHCSYRAASTDGLSAHARAIHRIHVIPRGKEDQVKKCRTCNETFWSYSAFVLHSMSHLQAFVVLERLKLHTL